MILADRIRAFLRQNGGEAKAKEVVLHFQSEGDTSEGSVRSELSDMKQRGDLAKPRYGYYALPRAGDGAQKKPAPPNGETGEETQDVEAMKMDMTTGGGAGGTVIQERPIAQYTVDYVPLGNLRGRHPEDAFTTRMIGNSMTPELQPNARIVVEPYPEGAQRIETDGMYVFRLDGEVQVKQLEWKPRKRLLCKPTNEKYERFELDLSDDGPIAQGDIDFAIIGRVWGHFCLL